MTEHKRVNFLLVEDDDDHAHLVGRSLRRSGLTYQLERVSDGVAALSYLRKEGSFQDAVSPDVILLDLNLPKKNGLEVLEEIRADQDLENHVVVMLTTSTAVADRKEAYARNVNSYLLKPVDFDRFQQMISELGSYWGSWNQSPPCR